MSEKCPECGQPFQVGQLPSPVKCSKCGALLRFDANRQRYVSSDPNQEAARVVREATASNEKLPASVEAAWERWSKGIQKVDERVKSLLRAAFEAGVDAARKG